MESADGIADAAAGGSGEVSPEAGCEDAGLSVEVWDGAVIPNYVICFLYFLTQVELGGDYLCGDAGCKPALSREAEKLRVAVAGHDDDAVKMRRCPCLIEQGNVNEQPCALGTHRLGERGPASADDGMQDAFERLAPGFVAKDEGAQFRAVGSSGFVAGFGAECRTHFFPDGVVRGEQFMHAAIGVEMFHRQLLAQMLSERGFPRGDAAGETDDWQSE